MTKKKMKQIFNDLEWNVTIYDFSSKDFTIYNILSEDLFDDIMKLIKKPYKYKDIKECVRKWGMYHYWCKSEFEIIIKDLFERYEKKIDAWYQIEQNLDRICEYLARELQI